MNRLRRFSPACLALVMLVAATAGVARGQVLKQVPADAMVVIKFNNLKQTSDRISALATKFGIAEVNPAVSDPLGNFKQAIGATAGLNEAGEAALVVMAKEEGAEDKKPDMIVLLPVSDYKAFIGNFADAKTEGDVTEIKFPQKEEPAFVSQWGDYAAISSESKAPLAKKPAGLTPTGLAAKELEGKDITIFANMKAVRDRVLPKLKSERDNIKEKVAAEMKKNNPKADEKYTGLATTMVDQALTVVEQFLQQADAATFGIALSESSIKPTGILEFDPKSNWGQSIAQMKGSSDVLTKGLPDAKYLFVGGYAVDQAAVTKLIDSITGPIDAELAKLGDEGKPFVGYINAFKSYIKATKGGSGGWVAPSGTLGQDALIQGVGVIRGDSKAILDAQREMFNTQQAMMDALGAKAEVQTTYTANAKTVEGVTLNQFSTKFAPAAGQDPTPQQVQMQQMMTWMYGADGMNGYIGALGADKVVVATGVNDETIGKLITAAKADETSYTKAAQVQQISKELPKERIMVFYVPLDNIAMTVVNYAKQFGMPVNVQLPENLPPVAVTAGTDGSAIRFDAVVPADTVQSLVAAAMQAKANMQAGPRGGGAGEAAP